MRFGGGNLGVEGFGCNQLKINRIEILNRIDSESYNGSVVRQRYFR